MSETALFVDLPNFYSRLLRSGIETPRFLRDYFLDWLDFDLLAKTLTESYSGIWVFYSGERIGPSGERVQGEHLRDYVRRINALEGVTARDVNIRGEQREPMTYKCESCGHEGLSEYTSEKGVDSSITVHMFDTAESWDMAFLLSGDADFVPAVASLRRKGKIVVGVGFSDASEALVRECYHYINLEALLKQDVFAYSIFKKDGLLQNWLTSEVHHNPAFGPPPEITMSARVEPQGSYNPTFQSSPPPSYWIQFNCQGTLDSASRSQWVAEAQDKLQGQVHVSKEQNDLSVYGFSQIADMGFQAMKRRLNQFLTSDKKVHLAEVSEERMYFHTTHQLDEQTSRYMALNQE